MSLYSQLSKNYETRLAQFLKRRTAPARKDVIPQTTIGASGGAVVQPSGGLATQLETKGDLLTFSDVEAILGIGANGERLEADSSQALGMKWSALAAIAHTDLSDMPSGSNTDHDDRYYFWIRTGTVLSPKAPGDTLEIAQTSLTGNALKVTRDLASGDTNAPVVFFHQDNAGDAEHALVVQQDSTQGAFHGIQSTAVTGQGVRGISTSDSGVAGISTGSSGVRGESINGNGVFAVSTNSHGVKGATNSAANNIYGGHFNQTKVGLYADFDEDAAPAAAPANDVRVYALTGGLMYARDDGTGVGIHKLSNIFPKTAKSGAYTADTLDDVITCDAIGGAFTITLYPVSGNAGRVLHVIKTDSSVNKIIIDGDGSETINGSTTYELVIQYETVKLWCDGTEWFIL